MNPKRIVADGYNRIAEQHNEWTGGLRRGERGYYTSLVINELSASAKILELGCGSGLPTTKSLSEEFMITGVDISQKQIDLAAKNVPDAEFICGDMTGLKFPPQSFNAVLAFYSIIHVPRNEHPELLRNIEKWLYPGGLYIATMGAESTENGYEENWLGAPMYWSSYDSETNIELVSNTGLEIISADEKTAMEFGKPVTFLWIVARKPLT